MLSQTAQPMTTKKDALVLGKKAGSSIGMMEHMRLECFGISQKPWHSKSVKIMSGIGL